MRCACVCVCDIMLRRALKEFLKHSRESRRVPGQEREKREIREREKREREKRERER